MGIFYSCTVTEVMKAHATVWWVYHNMREYIGMHPPNSWAFMHGYLKYFYAGKLLIKKEASTLFKLEMIYDKLVATGQPSTNKQPPHPR